MAKKASTTKVSEKPVILTEAENKVQSELQPVEKLAPYTKILATLPDGKQVEARTYKWDGKPGEVLIEALDGSMQYDSIVGWMPYPENKPVTEAAATEEATTGEEQANEPSSDAEIATEEAETVEPTTTTNETTAETQP